MNPDAKLERKIVRTLGKFLAEEQTALAEPATFVEQWPAVRQFIDTERVRQRNLELDGQSPK